MRLAPAPPQTLLSKSFHLAFATTKGVTLSIFIAITRAYVNQTMKTAEGKLPDGAGRTCIIQDKRDWDKCNLYSLMFLYNHSLHFEAILEKALQKVR